MSYCFRYVLKTLLATTVMVLAIFVAVQLFIGFSNELVDVGSSNYGFIQALVYVSLTLPNSLYALFPIILLVASLLGWGRLSQSSELVIFQMSGVSLWRLAGYIFLYSLFVASIMFSLGEFLGPYAYNKALRYKDIKLNSIVPSHVINNVWLKSANDYYFIRQVANDDKVLGMIDFHFSGKQLQTVTSASTVVRHPSGWVWKNVRQLKLSTGRVRQTHFKNHIFPTPRINYHLLIAYHGNISAVNLFDLYHLVTYLRQNHINHSAESYMFWHRVLLPLTALMMALLALPFMVGSFRAFSMFSRISFGLAIGLFYYLFSQMISSLSVLVSFSPFLVALAPIVFFLICYSILMFRTNQ